jgi:hypothetical protein
MIAAENKRCFGGVFLAKYLQRSINRENNPAVEIE